MAGEAHTLTAKVTGNNVEVVMASIPKSIQQALDDQKQEEKDLISTLSAGAEQDRHKNILAELKALESWYSAELTKIKNLTGADRKQIGSKIKNLAEQLKNKIVILGNTYGLRDLVYKSLGINELLSKIHDQVHKELRKHYNPSTPQGKNDGHNNTATAAEALGWKAPWGKHDTRTRTAEALLTGAISALNDINLQYGVNLSHEPDYIEGVQERDDSRQALSNPVNYLAAKGLKVDAAGSLEPL